MFSSSRRRPGPITTAVQSSSDKSLQSRFSFFDQTYLPVAVPILQLFFTCDCVSRRCERFDMNEAMHTVFLDEFRTMTAAMLLKPCPQVIGDADVERSMSAAGEDVDVIYAYCAHGWYDLARTLTPVVMGPGLRRDDNK